MKDQRKREVELFFTNEMLHVYGCSGCIFKEMDQCPHKLIDDEKHKDGYCKKIIDFLTQLAEHGDSVSAVKEKFHIFIQEMQSLADRKEYLKLKEEYEELEKTCSDPKVLGYAYAKLSSYKSWWARLSESVIKGLSRVADREQKSKVETTPKLTVQQLNELMKESRRLLENKE